MGRYLRDSVVKNVTVNEEFLRDIADELLSRTQQNNENPGDEQHTEPLTFTIRFDGKGYRFNEIDELLKCYSNANKVERITIEMSSTSSRKTQGYFGYHCLLTLFSNDPSNCRLEVSGDDQDWVLATYSVCQDMLENLVNKNGFVRAPWTTLAIQLFGVVFGFVLSLFLAEKISPFLAVNSPFVISFLFILFIYSNFWMYGNQLALKAIDSIFPNITFQRINKSSLHWIVQTIVGTAIATFVLVIMGVVSKEVVELAKSLLIK